MKTQYEQLTQQLLTTSYTWLVTGVAGFIGSNLLAELLHLNQKVIGLDNFTTGTKKNLDEVLNNVSQKQKNNFHFYEGDICQASDCDKAMQGVDFVLHQAALGSIPRSIKTPEVTNATNVVGFLNVIQSAKNEKVKRFVYASSSSVYGDAPDLPKKENKIGTPLSPYAVSKYTNELYAAAFAKCYGIETMGLRYFNVFGPRQDPSGPYSAVIPRWIHALLNNKPVYINGDGKTTRDFCYVSNAVQANLLAATTSNPDAINQVYNVAIGDQNSLNKLYELIVNELELSRNNKLIYQDFRLGDIKHSLADMNKAKELLGYRAQHNLEAGLKLLIQALRKNWTAQENLYHEE